MSKVLLYVPFEQKEQAKEFNCKYDADMKAWFCNDDNEVAIERWSIRHVDIPFDKKDEFKLFGCKWDGTLKKWYTYNSNRNI